MKSFALWYYFIKVAFLVGGIVGMEAYCHYNAYYGFPLNVLVGLFAALIGTKIRTISFAVIPSGSLLRMVVRGEASSVFQYCSSNR